MKARVSFSLDVWVDGLEVEGRNEEDIINEIRSMDLADIIEYSDVRDFDVKDADFDIIEDDTYVHIYNIEYENPDARAPKEYNIYITKDPHDGPIDDSDIEDEIYLQSNEFPTNFEWEIK